MPPKATAASNVPVLSLPQTELLTVNTNDIPIIRDALAPGVNFQPLFLDPEAGIWVLIAHFSPGAELPVHLHTGSVHGYTLSGKWMYREYPDQPQTAGSYLYEPGSSRHQFYAPEDNTEDTQILFVVYGANINFTPEGQFHSVLDAITIKAMTEQLSEAQGLGKINYITTGGAGYTAK